MGPFGAAHTYMAHIWEYPPPPPPPTRGLAAQRRIVREKVSRGRPIMAQFSLPFAIRIEGVETSVLVTALFEYARVESSDLSLLILPRCFKLLDDLSLMPHFPVSMGHSSPMDKPEQVVKYSAIGRG